MQRDGWMTVSNIVLCDKNMYKVVLYVINMLL